MPVGTAGRRLSFVVVLLLAARSPAAQSRAITPALTGQAMIRSDVRLQTPDLVTTLRPLLRGDVVFTNYEAAVGENCAGTAARRPTRKTHSGFFRAAALRGGAPRSWSCTSTIRSSTSRSGRSCRRSRPNASCRRSGSRRGRSRSAAGTRAPSRRGHRTVSAWSHAGSAQCRRAPRVRRDVDSRGGAPTLVEWRDPAGRVRPGGDARARRRPTASRCVRSTSRSAAGRGPPFASQAR